MNHFLHFLPPGHCNQLLVDRALAVRSFPGRCHGQDPNGGPQGIGLGVLQSGKLCCIEPILVLYLYTTLYKEIIKYII